MRTSADLSRLEGAILQAAVDPAAWPAAMAAFVETFPGARANLLGFDTQLERSLPATQAGYDDALVADYDRYYHAINPHVLGWVRLPVGQIIHSTDLVPEEEILRTEFYRNWVRRSRTSEIQWVAC